MPDDDVPVLIAGGSLVGMSMAMLLGGHGIASLVVERHRGAAIHPRAAFLLQRTMEILRAAGIEADVREGSHAQFEPDGAIMSAETLAGREIAYHLPNVNAGVRDMSPCERLFVTQVGLEPMLRARAEALGADVRFGTELVEFAQDADGVTAVIRGRDSAATREVRARYLVAADGPRSPIRDALGIAMTGRGVFSKAVTIYFGADVEPLLRGRNLSVVLIRTPSSRASSASRSPTAPASSSCIRWATRTTRSRMSRTSTRPAAWNWSGPASASRTST